MNGHHSSGKSNSDAPLPVTRLVPSSSPPLGQTTSLPNGAEAVGEVSMEMATLSGLAGRDFGDYQLLQEVGRGGMGVVYKARQRSLDRIVAVKMILGSRFSTPAALRRFQVEARAAASLDHPNIVPIHEVGEVSGQHYFTMAFVDGPSLSRHVRRQRLPAPRDVVRIMRAVADAIHHAHTRGVIHRDLKPSNVLLDGQQRPRIADFGLARRVSGDSGLTSPGEIIGTPSYMAPEQALGREKEIGPHTDVYGLGGLFYFLLTGHAPFVGSSLTETLLHVVDTLPTPPRQRNPQVSQQLEDVCLKCLQKAPAQRYPSAAALVEVLDTWLARRETQSLAPPPPDPACMTMMPVPVPPSLVPSIGTGSQSSDPTAPNASPTPRSRRLPAGLVGGVALLVLAGLLVFAVGPWRGTPKASVAGDGNQIDPAGIEIAALLRMHHDFRLDVELENSKPGNGSELLVPEEEPVFFRLQTERDAYVGVWIVDARGDVTQVFPNQFEQDHLVRAGQPRKIPDVADDYWLRPIFEGKPEQVLIVASTHRWGPIQGQREGPFVVFNNAPKRAAWKAHMRAIVVQPKQPAGKPAPAISTEELRFRVVRRD